MKERNSVVLGKRYQTHKEKRNERVLRKLLKNGFMYYRKIVEKVRPELMLPEQRVDGVPSYVYTSSNGHDIIRPAPPLPESLLGAFAAK